jgi:hypothetical protein
MRAVVNYEVCEAAEELELLAVGVSRRTMNAVAIPDTV